MIAYNKDWLYHLFVRQQTDQAFDEGLLEESEKKAIYEDYKVGFYSPNLFIRIGLFLLTVVILLFSFGLLSLLFLSAIEHVFEGLFIFFGLMAYIALELIIKNKKHYQSGVDDALLWSSASLIIGGISFMIKAEPLANCMLIFFASIYCTFRFADKLMAVVVFLALLGMFFFGINRLSNTAQASMPFLLMAVSVVVYFFSKAKNKEDKYQIYSGCLMMLEIVALLGFYCFGNYWVIQNLSNSINNSDTVQPIHLSWLFWLFTIVIPLFYIFRGVQKKDVILLRVGLLLVAAMVFTIRYYHSIAPLEIAMTVGGLILITIGWVLTRYLQTPKFGFTYQEINKKHALDSIKIESLIIAETFSRSTPDANDFQFGGGTGGGGGASGDF